VTVQFGIIMRQSLCCLVGLVFDYLVELAKAVRHCRCAELCVS
jgi:hypothetical protein